MARSPEQAADVAAAASPEAPEPLTLERFLPYRLNVLATTVSNALARVYAERFGLTIPQWRVLATLGQYERSTARDIAAHAVMHKSTVSRAVSALAERGLLERQPNAADMREEMLALTGQGRGIYEALVPEARAFERALAGALSPQEEALLFKLIERLDAKMRTLAPDLDLDGSGG